MFDWYREFIVFVATRDILVMIVIAICVFSILRIVDQFRRRMNKRHRQ